ncbi:PAS domain-containing hybrid sensor histidine kinase/response regulator [Arthrospiribacter ruber]|uniref:histidine kinase n=1 Tax=Arthrospiribacter ruber TaxID=2487934 RepID=A0A951IV19_9BACT|nr:ATP-binding protein [Arthrospiribacter ruber]MBW3466516.1 response regulator [Arthrospiribacter ruber]
MKERGINSTFKKIIYESSEMVFLADDTYPYNIFYSNQAFENLIGQFLEEKSLVGLGLDINSYIFNEELILNFMGVEYTFFLELPQENASNYFLFYKGKEMRGQGLPTKKDSQYFFRNTVDLIGIGQETYLTWVSNSVKPMLGYSPEEVVNIELCSYFHPDDLEHVRSLTFDIRQERKNSQFVARLLTKGGEYRWFEFQVHFIVGKFYAMGRDITEMKSEILERENLNELYALGEEIAEIGFFEISPQANTVFFTEPLKKLLGVNQTGDLTLEETINIFQDSDRPILKEALSEMMATGKQVNLVLEVPAREENSKWVKLVGQCQKTATNQTRLFGTMQDITKSFEEQNKLDVYRELFYLSPDPMIISDLSGNIIYSNQASRTQFAPDDQIAFPNKIGRFEPILNAKEVWDTHVEQLTSSGNKLYQSTVLNSAAKEFDVEVNAKFIQVQGNTFIVSIYRAISERELPALPSSSGPADFLHHLTEHIPGALYQFILDKDGEMKFSYLSPGIKNLLDLNEDEMADFNDVGKAISKVHPEDIAQVLTSTVSSARKLSTWICKFRIKDPSTDDFKWVQGAAKPEALENGDVVWYGYLTDITDQKMFEDKLRSAREDAMKASQVKSEFLSIISHELRTPLNAISGSIYSLLQDDHTPVQKSAFNTINFAVENLITMINDLLDFQKIEAGKLTLENSPINLESVVKRVVEGLQFHAKDSGNQLQLKFNNNLDFEIKGDKVRIAQVLNNLISNALKFTKNGNVDVMLELKSQTDSKVRVYFEVRDNGIGIADEHKARIFNEFDQIQHSFSKKYGGTGLGLSITKKLLDLMNSKIDLHSELNVGSTFFFEIEFEKVYIQQLEKDLPKSEQKEDLNGTLPNLPKLQVPIHESKVQAKGPSTLNEVKLLMVEDNDVNALVLGKIIKKWGIQFERVSNGKLAVEAMQQGEFDCILMDIQMPVMNGFEATEKIKEFSNVPILALSAADKVEVMEKIDQTGFAGFVAKPIDAAELLKRIKEVLHILSQSA